MPRFFLIGLCSNSFLILDFHIGVLWADNNVAALSMKSDLKKG